jgi:anti-sigma factor RsiW
MKCADCVEVLTPFIDGELPADEAAEVREHLQSCAACTREHRRLSGVSSQLKGGLMRYQAPDVLKARIRASISGTSPAVAPVVTKPRGWLSRWPRAVAAGATIAILSSALTFSVMHQRGSGPSAGDQILASHIRSLMPGHLTDVASNDQHNVKPWFNGRVDVSPSVPRLDSLGYPLLGGRLDYVQGRNVAAVVYGRRQHMINVFSWPARSAGDLPPTVSSANGYHLIQTRRSGVETWIVSDLNLRELEDFATLFQRASADAH